jgi:hypothetical protein
MVLVGGVRTANLALSFLLELAVLVAVGVWGFTVGGGLPGELVLGLGAPVLFAVLWGICAAPKSTRALHGPLRAGFELTWFGSGVAALAASGRPVWAVVLGVLCVANQALAFRWHQ